MPFGKHVQGRALVYRYGLVVRPGGRLAGEVINRDRALDAMRGRNALWNAFVELERTHQAAIEALLAVEHPAYAEAKAAAEASDGPDWTTVKSERRAAFALPTVKLALASMETTRRARVKELCRESQLYWCNYEDVVQAYDQARRKPGELHFHAWSREVGKLTVRWQQGLADPFAGDSRMQLTQPDARGHALARVRIASDDRAPIWFEAPVVIHRPLPNGATVRSASVLRERIGTKERWHLVLVLSLPDEVHPKSGPVAAVDLGFRKVPDGLRVATWLSDTGGAGSVVLPGRWIRGMAKVDDIQAIRQHNFNEAIAAVRKWLDGQKDLAEWLSAATATISRWVAPARLAALTLAWRDQRLDGDADIYELIESWRKRDKHLLEYQAHLRDQLQGQREHLYREFAAMLVANHGTVRLESFDLRKVARVKRKGQTDPENELVSVARHQRVLAAPSLLRLAITNAARQEGTAIETMVATNSTRQCSWCGHVDDFDAAAELMHQCSACGRTWDQDVNAARNLLSRTWPHKQAA